MAGRKKETMEYTLFMSEVGNDHRIEQTSPDNWEFVLSQVGPGRINEGTFHNRKLAEIHRDKLRASGEYK